MSRNKSEKQSESKLPDVSIAQKTEFIGKLAKVGMAKIEMPVLIETASSKTPVLIPALVNAYVSLDAPEDLRDCVWTPGQLQFWNGGETVALVGRSGGGKTSLVNLVPRFYPLTSGRLLVDGLPVEDYRLAALRRHIAYVGQHIVLFNGTLYDNIAYGALRDVDRADVERVVAQAQVKAFADTLLNDADWYADRGIALVSLRGETDFLRQIRATAEHTIGLIADAARFAPLEALPEQAKLAAE